MLKLQHFGHLMQSRIIGKGPGAGKDWRQEEKGATEDEMVGWHHRLNRHESEQTQEDSRRQGSLACCSPWGCKESDTAEQLNNNNIRRHASDSMFLVLHWNIRVGQQTRRWVLPFACSCGTTKSFLVFLIKLCGENVTCLWRSSLYLLPRLES